MKTANKLLITGMLMLAVALPLLAVCVYSLVGRRNNLSGSLIGGFFILLFGSFGVMMIMEGVRRNHRFASLKKNGARHIGRIFAHRKEKTNDLSLIVRYFDENGNIRQIAITTDTEKKEDYPIATDVVFLKLNDDAALLEKCGIHFSEEEHERLVAWDPVAILLQAKRKEPSKYTVKDITDIIAPGDATVQKLVEEVVADPAGVLRSGRYHLEDRGMEEEFEDEIRWLCMVEILLEQGYACELDYKESPDEFVSAVTRLRGMGQLALTIDETGLEGGKYISDWCYMTDRQWEKLDCSMGCIDIESDSYILFPCKNTDLETLMEIAADMDRVINYGGDS